MRRFLSRCAIGAAIVSLFASHARAQSVADSVISYNSVNAPPVFGGGAYDNASASLGLPTADTGFGDLTPFESAFSKNQITGIGPGGSLVLHMSQPVRANGVTLGVHAAVGLVDTDYPNGHTNALASTYTDPRIATLSVSQDDVNFFPIGVKTFDLPSNYYAQGVTTPGNDNTVGTPADFFKPFTGTLNDFADKNWTQVQAILNNSAGGNWLDLSSAGLPFINYVRFDVAPGNVMYVDSVVGTAVPEPVMCLLPAMLVFVRRPIK